MPERSVSQAMSELSGVLAVSMVIYVVALFGVALIAHRRVKDTSDFLVAGRRLSLFLAWASIFATWFGAGTMLAVTEAVREHGLVRMALDPIGAGVCLLLTGLLFARPLWHLKLLTLPDFFGRRFGSRAEFLSAVLMVPSYFGWIAAQFVALGQVLNLFFGLPLPLCIVLTAIVGLGYTLLGGMWSVTLTEAIQMAIIIAGLLLLFGVTLSALGDGSPAAGLTRLWQETPVAMREIVPLEDPVKLVGWIGVFLVGSLGNIPGQDLMQRVFASRSAPTAGQACLVAGVIYLAIGLIPPLLGLAANILAPEGSRGATLPALAALFLSPPLAVVFVLVILSAVLSTVDSAILSPSGVLAQNILPRLPRLSGLDPLKLNRLAVIGVTAVSLGFAFLGESAYSLLENAYELPLVSLLVPLAIGLWVRTARSESASMAGMIVGTGLWLLHHAVGWSTALEPLLGRLLLFPVPIFCTLCALATHLLVEKWDKPA